VSDGQNPSDSIHLDSMTE